MDVVLGIRFWIFGAVLALGGALVMLICLYIIYKIFEFIMSLFGG